MAFGKRNGLKKQTGNYLGIESPIVTCVRMSVVIYSSTRNGLLAYARGFGIHPSSGEMIG